MDGFRACSLINHFGSLDADREELLAVQNIGTATVLKIQRAKREWFERRGVDLETDDGTLIQNAKRKDIRGATGEQLDGMIWELDEEVYRIPASLERWARATVTLPDDEADEDDRPPIDHHELDDPWRREQARRDRERSRRSR